MMRHKDCNETFTDMQLEYTWVHYHAKIFKVIYKFETYNNACRIIL